MKQASLRAYRRYVNVELARLHLEAGIFGDGVALLMHKMRVHHSTPVADIRFVGWDVENQVWIYE